jgi:hypothetical protein
MRSGSFTKISLLEHLRYLFNSNTVCHMKHCSFGWLSSSHADVAVVLDKGAGRPATVYLTVSLAANPRSSTINRPAEGADVPSAPQHAVDLSLATAPTFKPLSASANNLPIESDALAPPTTDCKADISPTEKALQDADNAVKTMDLYNTWDKALGRIRWVMDTIGPIAEVRTVFLAYHSLR